MSIQKELVVDERITLVCDAATLAEPTVGVEATRPRVVTLASPLVVRAPAGASITTFTAPRATAAS